MKKNIFTLYPLSKTENSLHYQARINSTHPVFNGHFPEHPILPGVCSMDLIKLCLGDALNKVFRYSYVKECKFLTAVEPEKYPLLDVKITIKPDTSESLEITALIYSNDTTIMKLKATLI